MRPRSPVSVGRLFQVLLVVVAFGALAACGSNGASSDPPASTPEPSAEVARQDDPATASESSSTDTATGEAIEWEDVRVFVEYNSEGGDYGFHSEFGGEPWSTATIVGPDGETLFDLSSGGSLGEHGMAGVFFESAEFPPEELPLDDFLSRFPEGDYIFTGQTLEGEILVGTSTFTHLIPEPPVITDPVIGDELSPDNVIVAWDIVTEPEGIEIEAYTLQLFPVDPPEGQDPIALNIDYTFEVPGTINQIRLLPELFQPGQTYAFELMAIVTDGGNQSFSVGEFTIEDNPSDIDPAAFTKTVDNPFLPLPVGAQWEYEVITAEGAVDRVEVEVLPDKKSVMGIEATSVRETLFIDGEIEENTVGWYAQDDAGNVWLLGELDESYEGGELVDTATWEAGIDSAVPGILMPGEADLGEDFRVNFIIGQDGAITDRGRVVSEGETVEVTAGAFTEVRLVERSNNLQPHLTDRKYYAAGIGLVFEDSDAADSDTTELQSFNIPSE